MINFKESSIEEMIKRVSKQSILLPDFQRDFVWSEIDKQKRIVASVLTQMPIGSVLLLEAASNEYNANLIGCKNIPAEPEAGTVSFLLDGQQRFTVLTNVFSNIIHDNCKCAPQSLADRALLKRFFLRIPKWTKCLEREEMDIFGVLNLNFKYMDAEPDFVTEDIIDYIEYSDFSYDDKKPYNPSIAPGMDLVNYCLNYSNGYLIPLFLVLSNGGSRALTYNKVLENIAQKLREEIIFKFEEMEDNGFDTKDIMNQIFDKEIIEQIAVGNLNRDEVIKNQAELWEINIRNYLHKCLTTKNLICITVSQEDRNRAIDIYENMNLNGVKLSDFDLVTARVSKANSLNLRDRLLAYIKEEKKYSRSLVDINIDGIIGPKIDEGSYNASESMNVINQGGISIKYTKAFLNVLSLYCFNKEFDPEKYNVDLIKRNKILALSSDQINDNCALVCKGIDRALFFFQTRCGIRKINEIPYDLVLVLVSVIFLKDDWFNNKQVHNKLEAWYWSCMFGGEFDKDQNSNFNRNLKKMVKSVHNMCTTIDFSWINSIKDNIFNAQNFSDQQLVLMEKVQDARRPKDKLSAFVCQYFLSKTYLDMFNNNVTVSVFMDDADKLEAHHIIPLGSATDYKSSASLLRKDKDHICNSPLNFVYLTKEANQKILNDDIDKYLKEINLTARAVMMLQMPDTNRYSETSVHDYLKERYATVKGDIINRVEVLLR